jgi:hypothetical protein
MTYTGFELAMIRRQLLPPDQMCYDVVHLTEEVTQVTDAGVSTAIVRRAPLWRVVGTSNNDTLAGIDKADYIAVLVGDDTILSQGNGRPDGHRRCAAVLHHYAVCSRLIV